MRAQSRFMRSRLTDVARMAGVDVSTASRVLRGEAIFSTEIPVFVVHGAVRASPTDGCFNLNCYGVKSFPKQTLAFFAHGLTAFC